MRKEALKGLFSPKFLGGVDAITTPVHSVVIIPIVSTVVLHSLAFDLLPGF